MNDVRRTLHSPLTLLERWRDRVDGARLREVLIIGYTVDLTFLERFVVPTARALGARVTVLGDAGQAVHDPVDVRRAGVAYQHGHVVCARAFHPKLVVIAGDEDCTLAVGSGNPTLSGWGYNRELWLAASSSAQRGPQVAADVADWLCDLPTVVTMATWMAATLDEVAKRIRPAETDEKWSSFRAHGNLRRPLLDELPIGPVNELRLAAPFYDPEAAAVAALIDRLKPRKLGVAVQPDGGLFDSAALLSATASVASREFRSLPPRPATHGKLIEWDRACGPTLGMTGSANITTSALLLSAATGGNCELAVVAPHPESLYPEGEHQADAEFRHLACRWQRGEVASGPAPVLLGCSYADGILHVELATASLHPILIETSRSAVPGTWMAVGRLPSGQRTGTFVMPELPGTAVRAVADVHGDRRESAVVFVTNPAQCRSRRDVIDQPRLPRSYEQDQLLTDPVIAQRFSADLDRLIELAGTVRRPSTASSRVDVTERTDARDRWMDFLEDCEQMLGSGLAGLIFPPANAGNAAAAEDAGWSIHDADERELADGEDEHVLDSVADNLDRPRVPAVPPSERRRYRAFAYRWTDAVTRTGTPTPIRMTVTALYLTLLAAGVWRDDEDWRPDLRSLLSALVPDDAVLDELPPEAFGHLFALLAVTMATLRSDVVLHGGREGDLVATEAWQECKEWVAEADPEIAETLLLPATQPFARVTDARALRETIQRAQEAKNDPHAEPRAALAEVALTVRLEEGVWMVDGSFRNPYQAAARAATELRRTCGTVVVLARGPKCTVLLAADDVTMALSDSISRVWRIYILSSIRTPMSLIAGHAGPPPGSRTTPLTALSPDISLLGRSAQVDLLALAQRIRDTRTSLS